MCIICSHWRKESAQHSPSWTRTRAWSEHVWNSYIYASPLLKRTRNAEHRDPGPRTQSLGTQSLGPRDPGTQGLGNQGSRDEGRGNPTASPGQQFQCKPILEGLLRLKKPLCPIGQSTRSLSGRSWVRSSLVVRVGSKLCFITSCFNIFGEAAK